jgi:hypothetical protein
MTEYLSKNFPANDETDGEFLLRNLGSFWYQLFNDAKTLRGYTLGMAEELIQAYIYLIETINSYSIKDIDIFHKEKWYPIIIKKSEFNSVPFIFEPNKAVFGLQPKEDELYKDKLFRFGFPKETSEDSLYTYKFSEKINKISLISDKIIDPSIVLVPGVDYFLKENILYFNQNIFNNSNILKFKVLEDLGKIATYTSVNGTVLEDEFIVLWAYYTEVDKNNLYDNFGKILNIKFSSSLWYKDFLKNIINLSVESATIKALSLILATMMRVPVVVDNQEIVEDIYTDDMYRYVVTDKNTYKIDLSLTLAKNIKINSLLNAGDFITNNIVLIDSLIMPEWWKKEITATKLAFPSHVFLINAVKQLLFSNNNELVFYSKGTLTFPVLGDMKDVDNFQKNINLPYNKTVILKALNLFENTPLIIENFEKIEDIQYSKEQDIFVTTDKNYYRIPKTKNIVEGLNIGTVLQKNSSLIQNYNNAENTPNPPIFINPLDFIFSNIFKNNTLFLKLNFNSTQQLTDFFNFLPTIKPYLPPHVYFLIYVNFNIAADNLNNLNFSLNITDFKNNKFSCDGSISSLSNLVNINNPRLGGRPELNSVDTLYYKDYVNRLFCISIGPYKNGLPLHSDDNLEILNIDNSEKRNTVAGIKCGLMRTEIPELYTPLGEDTSRLPSTREIQSILLIDF